MSLTLVDGMEEGRSDTPQMTADGKREESKFDISTMIGCWRLWQNINSKSDALV